MLGEGIGYQHHDQGQPGGNMYQHQDQGPPGGNMYQQGVQMEVQQGGNVFHQQSPGVGLSTNQGQWGVLSPGQPPPPPSQHYGSYGQQFQSVYEMNAAQSMNFNSNDDFQYIFRQYASSHLDGIQAEELQKLLNDTPQIKNYYRVNWTLELCKILVAMLDSDRNGIMQYKEFEELLQCLVYWYQTFNQHDTNRSGFIEAQELYGMISGKFGYRISQQTLTVLLKRYSKAMDDGRCLIAFDDFVALSVRLRAYTGAFRARDKNTNRGTETGHCHFAYDDVVQFLGMMALLGMVCPRMPEYTSKKDKSYSSIQDLMVRIAIRKKLAILHSGHHLLFKRQVVLNSWNSFFQCPGWMCLPGLKRTQFWRTTWDCPRFNETEDTCLSRCENICKNRSDPDDVTQKTWGLYEYLHFPEWRPNDGGCACCCRSAELRKQLNYD